MRARGKYARARAHKCPRTTPPLLQASPSFGVCVCDCVRGRYFEPEGMECDCVRGRYFEPEGMECDCVRGRYFEPEGMESERTAR